MDDDHEGFTSRKRRRCSEAEDESEGGEVSGENSSESEGEVIEPPRKKQKKPVEIASDSGMFSILLFFLHPDTVPLVLMFAQHINIFQHGRPSCLTLNTPEPWYDEIGHITTSENQIFITSPRAALVRVFDAKTEAFLYQWSTKVGKFRNGKSWPISLAVDHQKVYVVDHSTSAIKVYRRQEGEGPSPPEFLCEWKLPRNRCPFAICLDEQQIFLTLSGETGWLDFSVLMISKADGSILAELGHGTDSKSFIATDNGPHIFVSRNHCVDVLDKVTGEEVCQLRGDLINDPVGITVWGTQVFVADGNGFVAVYNRDSGSLRHKLTFPAADGEPYWRPTALIVAQNRLLVVDEENRRIVEWSESSGGSVALQSQFLDHY